MRYNPQEIVPPEGPTPYGKRLQKRQFEDAAVEIVHLSQVFGVWTALADPNPKYEMDRMVREGLAVKNADGYMLSEEAIRRLPKRHSFITERAIGHFRNVIESFETTPQLEGQE